MSRNSLFDFQWECHSEDTDDVEMDQREHVGVEGPDQERCDACKDDDSVRVDESVAEVEQRPAR
jgi:hypothetical protein